MWRYDPPAWLQGGHAQTIWAARMADRGGPVFWRRERWDTPDGDFIDVDFGAQPAEAQALSGLVVLFHGLEGGRGSHYASAFAHWARSQGLGLCLPHFRGCSGEVNRAPRAYHSGDHAEVGWILTALRQRWPTRPIAAVGVSLGGNALLRWAQEAGDRAREMVCAVASVCAPLDLRASGHAIGRGFSRWVYTRMFLQTLKPKALHIWQRYPELFDRERMLGARDLYEFDNAFTAPVHGFRDTEDYWARASAGPHLHRIRLPALVLNARNDPFVPGISLPRQADAGRHVQLWQPEHGGHVGFAQGTGRLHLRAMPQAVGGWLLEAAGGALTR